jgi:hypothetical protein
MVASATGVDTGEASHLLAVMNQRKTPLIARRPVSPERRTNKNMRFEYLSLALAAKLGVEHVPPKKRASKKTAPAVDFVAFPKLPDPPLELPIIDIPPEPIGAIERMARLMGRRIARIMMEALQSEIEEQLDKMGNNLIEKWAEEAVAPAIQQTQKSDKPAVLIAGLLPNQREMIKQEFGEVFDLRFYMTDENLKKLRNMLKGSVDHFFTFTSKIEHASEDIAKSLNIKINRCSGGMTMLRQKLEELYVNG